MNPRVLERGTALLMFSPPLGVASARGNAMRYSRNLNHWPCSESRGTIEVELTFFAELELPLQLCKHGGNSGTEGVRFAVSCLTSGVLSLSLISLLLHRFRITCT
jgi:hypothetical protein